MSFRRYLPCKPPLPHPKWAQSVAPAARCGRLKPLFPPRPAGAAARTHVPCALPQRGWAPKQTCQNWRYLPAKLTASKSIGNGRKKPWQEAKASNLPWLLFSAIPYAHTALRYADNEVVMSVFVRCRPRASAWRYRHHLGACHVGTALKGAAATTSAYPDHHPLKRLVPYLSAGALLGGVPPPNPPHEMPFWRYLPASPPQPHPKWAQSVAPRD